MHWKYLRGLAAALCLSSCIVDEDDACDAHQVRLKEEGFLLCVCAENAVRAADGVGCLPCGENEAPKDGVCACIDGYIKNSTSGACELSEAGTACASDEECPGAFPHCAAKDSEGYCTSLDCEANAGCPQGWSCEQEGDLRYCKKPPTGLGAACNTSDDCAGYEANFCEAFQAKQCILQGCAVGAVTCPNEWGCCDYSGVLGSPYSTCLPPEQLTNDACPQGGSLVTP